MKNGESVVVNKYFILEIIGITLVVMFTLVFVWYSVGQKYIKNAGISISNKATSSLVHIKMVKPKWPGFIVSALAYELGYFKEEGIQIDYIDLDDEADIFNELSIGNIDVQGTLSTQYLSNVRKTGNIDSRIVLLTDYSSGGDALIARKDAPDLKSGKKKIISGLDDYEFFLPYTLDLLEANTNSIEYISIPSDEERIDMLLSGKIDYAVTYDPYLTRAVDGGASVIFTSADKPGVLTDVLLFSNRIIDNNPDVVKRFIKAYFKAYDFWKENPLLAYKTVYSFYKYLPEDFAKQMQRVKLLGLVDNINSISVNAGFNSIYGNLQTEQLFLFEKNNIQMYETKDMVYPNVLRELAREVDLNI